MTPFRIRGWQLAAKQQRLPCEAVSERTLHRDQKGNSITVWTGLGTASTTERYEGADPEIRMDRQLELTLVLHRATCAKTTHAARNTRKGGIRTGRTRLGTALPMGTYRGVAQSHGCDQATADSNEGASEGTEDRDGRCCIRQKRSYWMASFGSSCFTGVSLSKMQWAPQRW